MEVVYRRCSGVDVHKESISVCVLLMEDEGVKKQIRRFGTMTRDLLELRLWLQQLGVTHVAMESTGVYWKPVWNLLEDQFELLLVNAQHIKQVPGRKTDIRDCEWIADLLQHGLLRGSYVPKQEQRDAIKSWVDMRDGFHFYECSVNQDLWLRNHACSAGTVHPTTQMLA